MSSIRPLATITLLAAMGIFLYMKINESPESASSQAPAEWEDSPKFEIGDSAATTTPSADSAAPAFAPTPPALATSAPSATPPTAAPALPELPPISAAASAPPSEPLAALPTDTAPDITPPDTQASEATTPTAADVAPAAKPESAIAQTAAPPVEAPPGASLGLPPIPELPPLPEAASAAEAPGPVAPAPPESSQPVASDSAATTTPSGTPFDAARPAINAALSQGELSRAHLLLSEWYNESALTPAEKEEVQTLLNQLAGTVIYSNEHRLEPAYTVRAGETLETIAEKHRVPWQLLAKINGIASATAIQPGQTVKVVRGPFMGVVDVSDAELTLTIDGRFAGKYAVQLDGAAAGDGEWTVEQKQLDPAMATPVQPTASHAVDRKLVLRSADDATATIVISTATAPTAATAVPQGAIRIAPEHSEDLYDILSVGSRVVIRR
ncbi:MAG: LysM peptidoglycan-binding domain-containing protein [Pirellulales bacterium]